MAADTESNQDFRLPSLGADMEEATILEWRVKPGDRVARGDIVALIDTEKSEIDLEIWHGGVVEELVVGVGEVIPVGTVLARLRNDEQSVTASPKTGSAPTVHHDSPRVLSPLVRHLAEQRHVDLSRVAGTGPGGRIQRSDVNQATAVTAAPAATAVRASPRARALARRIGVDLALVTGTGPAGAIVAADVELAHPTASIAPAASTPQPDRERATSPRRAIAELMSRSNREIPHYYVATEIDCTRVMADLTRANEERPVTARVLGVVPLLIAAARATREHLELNGFWREGEFQPGDGVHLGVAVAKRGGGLVAPAIRDADMLGPDEMMRALTELVGRARAGRLRSSEMESPTITVTSLGDRGPTLVLPIIYPPQVAMVGFGRVVERPWVVDGELAVRTVVTASLAGDHRATDGDRGARFLTTLATVLTELEIP